MGTVKGECVFHEGERDVGALEWCGVISHIPLSSPCSSPLSLSLSLSLSLYFSSLLSVLLSLLISACTLAGNRNAIAVHQPTSQSHSCVCVCVWFMFATEGQSTLYE